MRKMRRLAAALAAVLTACSVTFSFPDAHAEEILWTAAADGENPDPDEAGIVYVTEDYTVPGEDENGEAVEYPLDILINADGTVDVLDTEYNRFILSEALSSGTGTLVETASDVSEATPSNATPSNATPSNAAVPDATASNATPSNATPSNALPILVKLVQKKTVTLLGDPVSFQGISVYAVKNGNSEQIATVSEGYAYNGNYYIPLSSISDALEELGYDCSSYNGERFFSFSWNFSGWLWFGVDALEIDGEWYIAAGDQNLRLPETTSILEFYPANTEDNPNYIATGHPHGYSDDQALKQESNFVEISFEDPDGLLGGELPETVWRQVTTDEDETRLVPVSDVSGVGYEADGKTYTPFTMYGTNCIRLSGLTESLTLRARALASVTLSIKKTAEDTEPFTLTCLEGEALDGKIPEEYQAVAYLKEDGSIIAGKSLLENGIECDTVLIRIEGDTAVEDAEVSFTLRYYKNYDGLVTEKVIQEGYRLTDSEGSRYYVKAAELVPSLENLTGYSMENYQGEKILGILSSGSTYTVTKGGYQLPDGTWLVEAGTAESGTLVLLPNNRKENAALYSETTVTVDWQPLINDGTEEISRRKAEAFYPVDLVNDGWNEALFWICGYQDVSLTVPTKEGKSLVINGCGGTVTDNGDGTSTVTLERPMARIRVCYVDDGSPTDIVNSHSRGITLNLFDYDDKRGVEDSSYSNPVNSGHTLQFYCTGDAASYGGGFNTWTGWDGSLYENIVEDTLGEDGKPRLNSATTGSSESLSYLFPDEGEDTEEAVRAYYGVNGLFQLENGYFSFDSAENYAEFVEEENRFQLYNDRSATAINVSCYGKNWATATDYDDRIINFMPFNSFMGTHDERDIDYHFGLELSFNYTQPESGMVNGKDMVYEFSGDDDVWIFIDGHLIGDLGGIHNESSITINFKDGTVKRTKRDSYGGSSSVDAEALSITDLYGSEDWKTVGSHSFRMYYMERGGSLSDLELRFNLLTIIPLVLNKTSTWDGQSVAGAVFGLFGTPECSGEPVFTSVDEENGHYNFGMGSYSSTMYLKELSAPEGYVLDETVYQVNFREDGTVSVESCGETEDGRSILEAQEDGSVLFPEDPDFTPVPELPETGGAGSGLPFLLGTACAAAAILFPARKKQ